MNNTDQKQANICPMRHFTCIRGPVKNKSSHQDQDIEQLRRVKFTFKRDRTLVKIAGDLLFQHVFFDADPGAHKEEHDERLCKKVDDARQDQEGHGAGVKNMKGDNALAENHKHHPQGEQGKDITRVHKKPHARPLAGPEGFSSR